MAVNMETVILMLAGWWVGGWLNTNYPKDFTWIVVTFPIAAVLVVHSWYVLFRSLMRPKNLENETAKDGLHRK